jgi:hypothetical protein
MMTRKNSVVVGALMGAIFATPAMAAAGNACLQHNRVWGWRALDQRTVVVTDRNQNRFTIHLQGGCVGLTDGASQLVFRTWQNLSCVGSGDLIGVRSPGVGFVTCSIADVQPGAPAAGPH